MNLGRQSFIIGERGQSVKGVGCSFIDSTGSLRRGTEVLESEDGVIAIGDRNNEAGE